jgi:Na+/melibiose symporter-like transporter
MEVQLVMVGLYGVFPLVCYVVGAILFSRFELDEKAYQKIRADLDERAQLQAVENVQC